MTRTAMFVGVASLFVSACVIREAPPANQPAPGAATAAAAPVGAATATAAPAPTAAPTAPSTPGSPAATVATPGAAPGSTPGATPPVGFPGMPAGMPTGMPTAFPGVPGLPGTPGATPAPGGLTLPGVCVPVGTWAKKFDNGLPASGSVTIAAPVIFNQFAVSDGVVVATMPAGTLKGTGAMTSTNDLSIDVSNAGYVLSYTCKFSGSNCNEGSCTVTKGGLGGFKLLKQ